MTIPRLYTRAKRRRATPQERRYPADLLGDGAGASWPWGREWLRDWWPRYEGGLEEWGLSREELVRLGVLVERREGG